MNNIHLFSGITSYIETIIVGGGYSILFITTLLEGIPILGMLVPGHVAIILGGFLAKIGTLSLTNVLIISVIGAIMGDFIGFYFGRKFGLSFIDRMRPYFSSTSLYIDKAQALLGKHTGKAMIIGRFSPVTRALMPFLVGASHTDAKKFWLFNIIGGVSWVFASVLLGYIFGAGYHTIAGYFGKFVVLALILTGIIIWGYRFINVRFHIFAKYEILTLILNIVSMWVLFEAIQDAWSPRSYFTGFDLWVNLSMEKWTLAMPWLAKIASFISLIGETEVIAVIGLVFGIYMALRKHWRRAGIMLVTTGATAITLGIMKDFFARVRPENALQLITSYSFPSGHAGFAAAFFTIVAYLSMLHMKSWVKRELVVVACVIATILIGLSRVLLNVHWASDVIAGWALGIFIATGSILMVRYIAGFILRKG